MVIPTGSATAEQRDRSRAYVPARTQRTVGPQGPRGMLFARDLVGPSDHIAEEFYAHAGFREVDELAFALLFSFKHDDYLQILTDIATRLGPALGWPVHGLITRSAATGRRAASRRPPGVRSP